MRLFVAEKPSLGRAIAAELGVTQNNPTFQICGSDTVTWCFGHILAPYDPQDYDDNLRTWRRRDLPIIPTEWKLRPKESALTQLQVINHLLSEAEMVVHAGDPDREGQLLVDEVLEHFHYTGPVQRIWLASLDSLSVQKALSTLKDNSNYANLRDAARARSQADWLIGMNASRAMTIFGQETGHTDGVLSLGRVQTPTLALVVQRDREIKAFVPVDYLILQASLQNDAGRFSATFKPAETQPGLDPEGHLVDESIPPRLPCRSAPGSPSVFSSHSLAKDNTMKRFYLFLFLLLASLVFSSPVLAADSTSFDPTKVMVQSVGASLPVGTVITWPSNSWPSDRDNWMECKGKSISSAVYPELVGVVGSRVPDYRGRFLRGLQSGYSVGQTVTNSLKSHNHTQPTHTHSFSGQLVSTALSGTAGGQSFSSAANLGVSGWAAGQSITSGGAGGQSFSYQGSTSSSSGGYVTFRHDTGTTNGYGAGGIIPGYSATPPTASWGITITENNGVFYSKYSSDSGGDRSTVTTSYVPFSGAKVQTMGGVTSGGSIWGSTGGGSVSGTASGTISGTANASSVLGNLRNGSVSGVIDAGGGDPTDYTGGSETAPDHTYVRCLIRAKP